MCEKSKCCQKPEQLKGKPGECTPEQIRKCHGDVQEHPCESPGCPPEGNKK
jgi:hypothetical protein